MVDFQSTQDSSISMPPISVPRPRETEKTFKIFDTLKETTVKMDVEKRFYDTSLSLDNTAHVMIPEEIKDFTLPGASPMAQELFRERVGSSAIPEKPFSGLARWYKENNPQKFSKDEWEHARDYISKSAVAKRASSSVMRQRTETTKHTTQKNVQTSGGQVRGRLIDRVQDIKKIIKKLRNSKYLTDAQINMMEQSLRTMKNFSSTRFQWPLSANTECCTLRDGRIGIDYVEDDVDIQLQKESEMLQTVGTSILNSVGKSEEVLDFMRKISDELHADIRRKQITTQCDHALEKLTLDARALRLNLNALDPSTKKDMIREDDWRGASLALMDAASDAIEKSQKLRKEMQERTDEIEEMLKRYEGDVTMSMRARLSEYEAALQEDEQILLQCRFEIQTTDKEIKNLLQAIDNKQNPLKRNTTRLERRFDGRPAEERTDDTVNLSLVNEAAEISAAVDALQTELDIQEGNLVELRQMEATLEEDIEIKKRSIKIEKKCLYRRSYFAKFKAEDALKESRNN
eukprot:m.341117 g.341117  ORF g.341117 m.341117 type:complete len:517 (+) comp19832_c0_seq1:221-1771(+)